jgi:IS30 family transposase
MAHRLTRDEIVEFWDRYAAGETQAMLARRFGQATATTNQRVLLAGGCRPTIPKRGPQHLTLEDREEISRGLAAGESMRAIARRLRRAPSTISREVAANGGPAHYRAAAAEQAAATRRHRPKVCKLAASPQLRQLVQHKLEHKWSPEQIAGWLKHTHPDDLELQVSHETSYRTLFIQSRGALKRELTQHLRTRRQVRQPAHSRRGQGSGKGQLVDVVSISERPAEATDRAVPGHWEGDLILGKKVTAIGTLVERSSRFVMLIHLDGIKSNIVVPALRDHVLTLPEQLRKSVTWDQGKEMALHAQFTIDTGIQIYFCDPKSPWQRGTNENTNGLLRQYFPRHTDLAVYTQHDLDAVAAELNGRPRKTLGFMTPAEKFAEAVAATH